MLKELLLPTRKNNYEAILLKKPFILAYFLLLLLSNYIAPLYIPNYNTVLASDITSTKLIELANLDRQNVGLNSLTRNSMLDQAAHAKALDMLDKDYWNHFGPNGETPWQFIKDAGYDPYKYAGENLAKGFVTSEGVHQAWMASPTHKANIMDADYRDIGIATVDGYLGGKKVTLVVQMFGTLKSDTSLNANIDADELEGYDSDVKPNTPESGETTSIKISYPKDGDVINSADIRLSGAIKSVGENPEILLSEGDSVFAEIDPAISDKSNNVNWQYKSDKDWEQGEYEVKAVVRENNLDTASDNVKFTIDSLAPEINESMLTIAEYDGNTKIILQPKEAVEAYISVDSDIYPFVIRSEIYEVSIPKQVYNSASQIVLEAADSNGNRSSYVIKSEEGNLSVGSILGLASTGGTINFTILAVLLFLIMIQVVWYIKLGLLQHKAHYLFASVMFSTILLIGIITKSAGVIG